LTPRAPRKVVRPRPENGSVRDEAPLEARFSVGHMDPRVPPGEDFYRFSVGGWLRRNPVPADKARWGGFAELAERNFRHVHDLLEEASADRSSRPRSVRRQVGDFYASALDTDRRRRLGLRPIAGDLARIGRVRSAAGLPTILARLHDFGLDAGFASGVGPDKRDTSKYALYAVQGGLSLPDRDYYLEEEFSALRGKYRAHLVRQFRRLGEPAARAKASAATVSDLETTLARASRTRTQLRDEIANYHKVGVAEFAREHPALRWTGYLAARGARRARDVIVGQPEFFSALDTLLSDRPIGEWRTYLRWHLLRASAPYLDPATEVEHFAFFQRALLGQERPEPLWKRAGRVIDLRIGEALGALYVERYFPPEARARAAELIDDLRAVFRDRLERLPWMTETTRRRALEKFDRFRAKIGHPDRFRDYSSVRIARNDYLGNVRRATRFEERREIGRIGGPVDRTEWGMTPPTVNAYFDSTQNEIVFPAGILQPPFFDIGMDDAVNYGAIGVVIGHEITHGYDDRGRKHDAEGNLRDWWSPEDAQEFERRAQRVVAEYNGFEALPGRHVNGELTLGENIADIGGVSLAFEALERRLAKEPSRRRTIDGLTPEQRFFISYAQVWRENCREPERRRLLTVDSHSPGRFRAIGPVVNLAPFYSAFGIGPGAPMWRPEPERVTIW
jgi:putative endopeptidase